MHAFRRLPCPEVLRENGGAWTARWTERVATESGARFRWPEKNGKSLNKHLVPHLMEQTQEHCSYCDIFPVTPASRPTIDHFRPCSRFPKDAFLWGNLYFCCDGCQSQKGDHFDDDLLRPDGEHFEFDRYFRWDYTEGTLMPNPAASQHDRRKAEVSIRIFGLNTRHPRFRRLELRKFQSRSKASSGGAETSVDDFAYRDFIHDPGPVARALG